MTNNRFKKNNPPVGVDFDDPAVLTATPGVPEEAPTAAPAAKPVNDNPLAGILEQKTAAKSYGYYLDDDVARAIEKLAKQNKTSKSKALNALLKKILLDK